MEETNREIPWDMGERVRRLGTSHLIAAGRVKNLRCVGRGQVGEDGFLRASVVTRYSLVIRRGCIIQGDIKSWRNVILEEGAVVCGEVRAGGSIFVGRGVRIYGALTAKGNIRIREGAVVGREESPRDVTARGRLEIAAGSRIYGPLKGMTKVTVHSRVVHYAARPQANTVPEREPGLLP